MDYKDAAKTMDQLCEFYVDEGRLTMTSHNIASRADWEGDACHYHFTISGRSSGTTYSGEYSKGWGCFSDWVLKRKNSFYIRLYGERLTKARLAELASMQVKTIGDEGAQNQVRDYIRKNAGLPLADVLSSLIMDANGSDQPYEEWAADLGYDEDSRKGYAVWETCNNIRRWLERIFDRDELDYLTDIAHSL